MSLMAEVKCGRCDRTYSSLKSRCPYCGARRNKNGKHADYESNSTAKLLIGILILVLLIVAVVVLVISSVNANRSDKNDGKVDTQVEDVNKDGLNSGEDITSVEGTDPGTTTNPSTTTDPTTTDPNAGNQPGTTTQPGPTTQPTTPAAPVVTDLSIDYLGEAKDDVTMSLQEELQFDAYYNVTPEDAEVKVVWSSSNDSVFTVLQDGTVSAIGEGSADLVLKVGDQETTCLIRVG